MNNLLVRFIDALERSTVLKISAASMLLIGWLDWQTSWETSLFIFYAGPISLVAWRISKQAGILLSAISGVVWFVANCKTHPYQSLVAYIWASANRTIYFVFVALGFAAFRSLREESNQKLEAVLTARSLERQLTFSGEQEQMRIGRDLHDGVCQSLAAIDCAIEYLRTQLERESAAHAKIAETIQKMVRSTIQEAKNLSRGLFPVKLDQEGLETALHEVARSMAELHGIPVDVEIEGDSSLLTSEKSIHVYRIAQEGLSNALRHAAPTHVRLRFVIQDTSVCCLRVFDNGTGFDPHHCETGGIGLQSIRHRTQILGGTLQIEKVAGGGTLLECIFPI